MNRHFVEMLRALSAEGAEFLIIGAHAVAAHGHFRATKDIDIWIDPSSGNVDRVSRALQKFGAPLELITRDDLMTPEMIFQIGVDLDPVRIDILTTVKPLIFADAWPNRAIVQVDGEPFPFLGRHDLIRSKRATGRRQDLLDLEHLERIQ